MIDYFLMGEVIEGKFPSMGGEPPRRPPEGTKEKETLITPERFDALITALQDCHGKYTMQDVQAETITEVSSEIVDLINNADVYEWEKAPAFYHAVLLAMQEHDMLTRTQAMLIPKI